MSGGLLFVLCAGVGLACGLLPACQAVCCQQAREAETRDPKGHCGLRGHCAVPTLPGAHALPLEIPSRAHQHQRLGQ